MGKAYSQDLRERVLFSVDGGTAVRAVAATFRVSVSYIYKAVGRRRATGETTARRSGGGPKPKLADHDEALRGRIAAVPDTTLAELQAWFLSTRALEVSVGCLWKRLNHLGLALKKSRIARPNRTARMSRKPAANGARGSRNWIRRG